MTQITEIRRYELMVILSGEMTETDFEKEFSELRKFLQESTKGITYEDNWGKRELSYKIKKHHYGYYVVFNFAASPSEILDLRNNIKLNPHVIRHLLIIAPENYEPGRYKTESLPAPKSEKEEKKPVREKIVEQRPAVESISQEKVAEEVKKPAKVAGKEEEDQLKTVEKKLEKILENPDIDIK